MLTDINVNSQEKTVKPDARVINACPKCGKKMIKEYITLFKGMTDVMFRCLYCKHTYWENEL